MLLREIENCKAPNGFKQTNFEQANIEIHAIKDKMKELIDIKQLNELSDIESFFGIKGLKEDNVVTKAKIKY
jgi:hypothetical protein